MRNSQSDEAGDGTMNVYFDQYRFRGGAPPYRGYHFEKRDQVRVSVDATFHDLLNQIKQHIDPGNKHDLRVVAIRFGFESTLEETDSVYDMINNQYKHIRVYVPMRRGHMDIGQFSEHHNAVGSELLRKHQHHVSCSTSELSKIVEELEGSLDATFFFLSSVRCFGEEQLQKLRQHVELLYITAVSALPCEKAEQLEDFKVSVSPSELSSLIGLECFVELTKIFDDRFDEILIRRCCCRRKHINFHVDYSAKTMQVALNDDTDYVGGRLTYICKEGLCSPSRPAGSLVIHQGDIVHGVSELESGVRYGLFFLQKSEGQTYRNQQAFR